MASVRRLPLVRLARLRQNTNLETRLDFTEFSNGGVGRNRGFGGILCMAEPDSGAEAKKASARLSSMRQVLHEAEELSAMAADSGPTPKITLDHVTVSFTGSGGAGRQNVNELNTKVDMRFNVNKAYWLCERIRENILQMEKNKINKDGELVISSTKTRTQKGNIDDALEKIQAIVDAASYVPPPPSEEQKKRIEILSAISEWKRLDAKKINSKKKISRRDCQNMI